MAHSAINYRLKSNDLTYIFEHAEVDSILVDAEFEHLLDDFRRQNPRVKFIIDLDADTNSGEYDDAVLEGLRYDQELGGHGWDGLETRAPNEESTFALSYTSGTTARPKGVEYTHRGAYLAALGNVIESCLNLPDKRCRYLWTLPMFHAMGETHIRPDTRLRAANKRRLDLSMGRYRCTRDTLLLTKDRLPSDMEVVETRRMHSL